MTLSKLEHAAAVAHALGHWARLRTLAMLRTGDLCVCQIGEVLRLAPSTVSAHLRELRQAGLTRERKSGRWIHVGLSQDTAVQPWILSALGALEGDHQVVADDHLVRTLRKLPVEDLCRLGFEAARARAGEPRKERDRTGRHVRRARA